jgi:uncharacterized membrane protein YccC
VFGTSSISVRPRETLAGALSDWVRTDGVAWIHIFKTVIAAMLALLVAMRLDLPQPRTAMTTLFVSMQPQSGMVLAKSFYRFCATIVGLVVMLTITALFSQQPVLFLTATAVWIGICTTGAARNRNFWSYGFVLAGYTAALIGIPAGRHPYGAFNSALTRTAEVRLGIICSGAVSAQILPLYAGEQIKIAVRRRFTFFVGYVSKALLGKIDRDQNEMTHAAFAADIVGFEAARSVAVFEHAESRIRSGRLARLNSEFMSASTRLHALHQLMNRMHREHETRAVRLLEPYSHEAAAVVAKSGRHVLNASDALKAWERLDTYKAALAERLSAARIALHSGPEVPMLEFDTAAEHLYRFVYDLLAYTQTYASLAAPSHERERWVEGYVPKTNLIAAVTAGFRAAFVTLLLSVFWLATAWPRGGTMVPNTAASCALISSSPRPTQTAFQMAGGVTLGAIAGLVVTFYLYARLDRFILLAAALTPFLMFGAFLNTRKSLAGVGVAYCTYFCFLAGPDNVIHFDPTAYINDAIALIVAMLAVSIAFAAVVPTDASWMNRLLVNELRRQVVAASSARPSRLATRFESGARDLLCKIDALAGSHEMVRREAMQWLFSVLEVGHTVIDMRQELHGLGIDRPRAPETEWRKNIEKTLKAVAHLFDGPTQRRFDGALASTEEAIESVRDVLSSNPAPPEEWHRVQRILSHLHFIRTALLDS